MHQVFSPGTAHQLQHLKHLLKMQGLLISYDVQAFMKIIFLLAVNGGGYVPRRIKAGAVLFNYYAGGHIIFIQHYHLRAFALPKQSFFLQFGYYGLPFILIKAFAGIGIKGYAQ